MPYYPPPDTSASAEEREALSRLAPLRRTLEGLVRRQLQRQGPRREIPEREVDAAVAGHWTLILEAYRLGVRQVARGLHRAEGLDHEMVTQSLDYALRDQLLEDAEKRKR
jgi:hypothetical protein